MDAQPVNYQALMQSLMAQGMGGIPGINGPMNLPGAQNPQTPGMSGFGFAGQGHAGLANPQMGGMMPAMGGMSPMLMQLLQQAQQRGGVPGQTQGIPQAPPPPQMQPQLQRSQMPQFLPAMGGMGSGMAPMQGRMESAVLGPLMQPNYGIPAVGGMGAIQPVRMGPQPIGSARSGARSLT